MHARNINTRYVRLIDCSPANILTRDRSSFVRRLRRNRLTERVPLAESFA